MVKKSGGFIKYEASYLRGSTKYYGFIFPLKPHTNARTVCGRPTLRVSERFMNSSLRGLYERSIYE